MPAHRALVVGAGIAGLATALRLRRSGWDVVVVERAPALRGGGYILEFGGVGYTAAERLGLVPALRAAQPAPVDLVHVDSRGRERARMDSAAQQALLGDRTLALFRGDLERALFDELDDRVEFRFGTSVDRVRQHPDEVQVDLGDGTSLAADLLVGADGVHSRVRSLLFGPEERYRHDFGDIVAITQLGEAPAAVLPGTSVAMDLVGRGVSVINPRGSRAVAFFVFGTDDAETELAAGPGPTLRRRYGDLGWIVPDLLAAVDDAETVYFDQVSQIRMDRWSVGRAVLVGDAAWCVSLFAGYGSSLAVAGATLLGDLLDTDPVPVALQRWEQRLRPIAERRRRQGRRAEAVFVAPNAAARSVKSAVLRASARPIVARVMRRFLALPPVHRPGRAPDS